ncbi:hypothetical protein H8K33_12950 [Undibacterium amnicola]|uniref:Uncharacterized protein n=1 Tax=Undibacterium amnicola TaxID=1834038 RepID=A0ABR6XSG2_9BURK|nr:hypothetical protein [Undibacterium amnicola]MBC3832407.1 hypothetical protein [Undibacterium amnicola]
METITFSYVDYINNADLINLLKRFAKTAKSIDQPSQRLTHYQDQVARWLGYANWSMLHKHLDELGASKFQEVLSRVLRHEVLGDFIAEKAVRTVVVTDAVEVMTTWIRVTYTPLVNFAYYDSESETGFSLPDVDLAYELEEEFGGRFPSELIQDVAADLEVDEGPWGLEDYGDD